VEIPEKDTQAIDQGNTKLVISLGQLLDSLKMELVVKILMKLHSGYFIIDIRIIFLCPFQIKVIQIKQTLAEPKVIVFFQHIFSVVFGNDKSTYSKL
jgi:hypothetical protein